VTHHEKTHDPLTSERPPEHPEIPGHTETPEPPEHMESPETDGPRTPAPGGGDDGNGNGNGDGSGNGDGPATPDTANAGPVEQTPQQGAVLFTHDRFIKEIRIDAALRWATAGLVIAAVVVVTGFDQTGSVAGLALAMLMIFAWIAVSAISAGVWRTLPAITAMIGQNPSAAEEALAQQIKRRPLMRWVRLSLYHRLASIRHRQHRFHESAQICRAILSQPPGPARGQRGRLLLMLAEANLQCKDLYGAYTALSDLHREPLGLVESLQRLALQTRYEVLAGHDRAALAGTRQKLLLSELMPPIQCGAMHAMLTASASRTGQHELADWLWRRSRLLCGPQQLNGLVKSAFAVCIVSPPDPGNIHSR
jgi:hypothetical protein